MIFDLLQSRNTYNEPCKWWSRKDDDETPLSDLIMKRIPTGTFYAKEADSLMEQNAEDGNILLYDKTTVTIKTPDNVKGIKNNDLVLYLDEKWIVVDVRKRISRNQHTYFAKDSHCSHFWYIELRK